MHERPVSWACREENWPPGLWPGLLPSQPTLSRRLRTAEVLALLERMERCFRRSSRAGPVKWIDGKPLVLGVYAKDPDAAWGRVGRSYAHGYKLLVVYGDGPLPEAWEVEPLNVAEPCVAARLLPLHVCRTRGSALGSGLARSLSTGFPIEIGHPIYDSMVDLVFVGF